MPDLPPTTCLNCGQDFTAKYCPECGQPATTGRLQLRTFLRDIADNALSLNSGLLRTVVDMTRDPGGTCRRYVEGQRRRYASPLRYCLTVLAISVLVYSLAGYDVNEQLARSNGSEATETSEASKASEASRASQEFTQDLVRFVSKYPSVTFFVPLPLIALVHRLMFRKAGRNYLEILVFNLFVSAHYSLLYLPIQVFAPLPFSVVSGVSVPLLLPYFVWAAVPFFKESAWKVILKTVAFVVVGYVVTIALVVAYLFATGSAPTPAG